MIHVVAILTAKPGRRPELLSAFADNLPAVLAEDGCIEYSVTTDAPDAGAGFGPDTVVVIEKWESPAALKAHSASAHMAAFGTRTKELRAETAVHVLQASL